MGRGKYKIKNTLGIVLIILMFSIHTAWALPKDGTVVAGSSTITQPGSTTLNITQSTDKSIINWQGYSIGKGETVQYFQPGSSSISLNRVTGSDPSLIYGNLIANGGVWVINPNGLLVGKNAKINAGSFLGSTLDINNDDFLSGKYLFRNTTNSLSSITNKGEITTEEGGYLVFLSPSITNKGTITTEKGKTYIASGDEVTLSFAGNSLVGFTIDKETAENALGITNTGKIIADGGEAILSAKVAGDVFKTVINNKGVIQAQTIEDKDGTIQLLGGMESNTINVSGTLDASAPDGGNGGFIETSAAKVKVTDKAVVTTAATEGTAGTWLIDPYDFMIATSGGDITGAALGTALGAGDVTIQTLAGSVSCTGATCDNGTSTGNGDIFVNDNITWSAHKLTLNAYRNIEINKELFGSGTAQLALYYGQGAVASGNTAVYKVNAPVNLPAGNNFFTKLGSNGTPINYYVITTLGAEDSTTGTDLQGMNGGLSGKYALGSNIDATATSTWNGGLGFAPIGTDNITRFTGRFDGLGHTISNLYINRLSSDYIGLFGFIYSGSVRNVGLTGGSVTGKYYVGGLVGENYLGAITNSYFTGSVSGGNNSSIGGLAGCNAGTITNSYATCSVSGGDDSKVGGLVGINSNSISNSYATGSVSGSGSIGGLVGTNNSGTITNAYATGSVSGSGSIGGLVGTNNSGTITNSYTTGSVIGGDYSYIGGLVGFNLSSGSISNSYATGNVSGSSVIGGLVGRNVGTITNSYWDTVTTGQATSAGGTGLTTAQMMQTANFSGWDFTNTWFLNPGNTRPFLRMEWSNNITNAHQLQLMAMNPGASYTLGANLDLAAELANPSGIWGTQSATILTGITKGFAPVGTDDSAPFTGKFDGLGHTISNLYINRPADAYVGLFGYTGGSTCVLQNIGLTGGSVTGNSYVGGLTGYNSVTITNSYATGSVSGGGGSRVGGLVGTNDNGSISNSYATGGVSGSDYIGGLAGTNNGSISNSYATGSVSGSGHIGGLVGINSNSISNSYATGSVIGEEGSRVGGLVGLNDNGSISISYATGNVSGGNSSDVGGLAGLNDNGSISNSYATGSVSGGNSSDVGGLAGENNSGTITNSYWDTVTTGQATSAGGTGLTTAQMMQTANFSGWDFTDTWFLIPGNTRPFLRMEWSNNITNAHQLQLMAMNPGASYTLGANLDLAAELANPSGMWGTASATVATGITTGFAPVGLDYDTPFTGRFDGLGHTIISLYINRPDQSLVGLFGLTDSGSSISNVGLVGGSVIGYAVVGGLVGYNSGTITNAYATGSVSGNAVVGGLVGRNYYGTITNAYATGSVSGGDDGYIGGLVGYNNGIIKNAYATSDVKGTGYIGGLAGNNNGSISNSYATGSVSGSGDFQNWVGGLVGINDNGSISNSYATGSVSGSGDFRNWVGGLVGRNYYGTITNAYATGSVSGGDISGVGGLVGLNDNGSISNSYATGNVSGGNSSDVGGLAGENNSGTITNSYWDTVTTGQATSAGGTGLTTAQMMQTANFSGWDFTDTWFLIPGDTRPFLRMEWSNNITNAHQLQLMAMNLGASYTLGANLDLAAELANPFGMWGTASATVATGITTGFAPVGLDYDTPFAGRFDGLGHTISNLYINRPIGDRIGLFGYTDSGSVLQNVGLTGGSMTGNSIVGGLAGFNRGTISNSYATGNVSGSNYIGGLVGVNNGIIKNAYATGDVKGSGYIGGLVGNNNFGTITNSYATGSVSGSGYIGGLVGANYANGTINNSYATGNVSGSSYIGGLVGRNVGTITNSYWDTVTTGQATSAGGTGLTTAQMMQTANFSGWDFTDTWWMSPGNTRPFLRMEWSNNITNAHQLQLMAMNLGASYTLGANLDLAAELANPSGMWGTQSATILTGITKGFAPVGTDDSAPFTGTFDGLGHTISNLYINRPADAYVGLFGYTGGSTCVLQNIGLTGGSVTGNSYVGGLTGYNSGTITNSYATGSVSGGEGSRVGGLVGFNIINGSITNSYATGSVSGGTLSYIGGLAGSNYGILSNSYATGSVSGGSNSFIGGLAGDSGGAISNSYATGSVSGGNNSYIGGLAGENLGTISNSYATGRVTGGSDSSIGGLAGINSNSISNSYATGSVIGEEGSRVGGLVGANYGNGTISNSYVTGSVTGGSDSSIGGLVGANYGSGTISNSYAAGSVSCNSSGNNKNEVGGLVGLNATHGTITDSYATGNVTGGASDRSFGSMVGGLVGHNTNATINNSYATGITTSTTTNGARIGGLVGDNSGTITNSFWNTTTNLSTPSGVGYGNVTGVTDVTAAQMMTQATFTTGSPYITGTGWDIANAGGGSSVWRIYEGYTYPLLRSFLTPLTITADNLSTTYNGSAYTRALTNVSYSVPGADTSGHLLGTGTPYGSGKNVGTYAPTLYSDQQGYDISYINGNLTINPRALTGYIRAGSSTYGSALAPGRAIFTNVCAGDHLGTATVAVDTTGNLSTSGNLKAGSYAGIEYITALSGADAGNYTFANIHGDYTVSKLALTGSIGTGSSVYGSDLNPGTVTFNNIISGDDVTSMASVNASTFSTSGKPVAGTYTQTAESISGADAGNYTFTGLTTPTENYTINPLALTGSIGAGSSVYGSVLAPGAATFTNAVSGDALGTATVAVDTTGRLSSSGKLKAGSYNGIEYITALSGDDAGNYTFDNVHGDYSVSQLALTGSIGTGSSVYGTALAPGAATFTNAVSGDALGTATVAVDTTTGNLSSSNNLKAGSYNGIEYVSALSGDDAGNYTFANVHGDYNVSKLALTGAAIASGSSTYGSDLNPGAVTFDNIKSGDDVTGTVIVNTSTFSTSGKPVAGTYTQTAKAISGDDAGNYTFTGFTTPTENYTINPLALTGSIGAGSSVYGLALTPGTASLSGAVSGDDLGSATVAVDTTGKLSSSNNLKAGSHTGIEYITELSGADAGNYTFANVHGDYNVSKLALTGSIGTGSSVYGSALIPGSATFTNAVAGDDLGTATVAVDTTGKLSSSNNLKAGSYNGIEYVSALSGADAGNYSFANVHGDYNVSKLALNGSIGAGSSVYGSALNPGAATFNNAMAGDALGSATVAVDTTDKLSSSNNLKAGSHTGIEYITALSGADAGNYTFANVHGDYSVSQLALTGAAIASGSSTYGSPRTPGAVTFDNIINGDDVASTASVNTSTFSTGGKPVAGTYTQTADSISGADADNYTFAGFTTATENYTIDPLALTGSIGAGSSVYGSALTPGAASLSGAISGDDLGTATVAVDTTDKLSSSGNLKAGSYIGIEYITALSGADAGNYTFANIYGDYTINPLAITGHITAGNKTYDTTTAATITGRSLTGAIDGDLVSYTGGTAAFDNKNAGTGKTVTATGLSLTGADAGNYTVNTTAATKATITPAALTIAANDDSKTYNGHAYSGGNGVTCNGFAGGETEAVLSGTLAYGGTSQGAVNAGSYTIIPSGLTSGNYNISYFNGTLTINRALLTVISGSLTGSVTKVYDGTNVATLSPSNYILSGWAGTDGATVNKTTGTYDTANAGTNKTVTVSLAVSDYTALGSTKLSNYILPAAITGSVGVITPAPLTITASNAGKTYDGLAYSGGNGVTYSGFVGGQTSSVLGGSLVYGGTSQGAINAGNYTIIPSGLTSGNYTINYVNGTLNISAQNIFHPVWYMYWLLDMENNEGGNPLNNMNLAGLSGDGFFKPHDRHWTKEGNFVGLPGQEDEDKKHKKQKLSN